MTVTNLEDVKNRIKKKQGKQNVDIPRLAEVPASERPAQAARLLEFVQNLIYVSHCLYTGDLNSLSAEHRAYVGKILGEDFPEDDEDEKKYNYVLRHGREIRDMADGVAATASEILDDVKNFLSNFEGK